VLVSKSNEVIEGELPFSEITPVYPDLTPSLLAFVLDYMHDPGSLTYKKYLRFHTMRRRTAFSPSDMNSQVHKSEFKARWQYNPCAFAHRETIFQSNPINDLTMGLLALQ